MQLGTLKHLHNTLETVRGQPQVVSTYAELLDSTVLHTITSTVRSVKEDLMPCNPWW